MNPPWSDTGLGYPSATSSVIITLKPAAKKIVPMLECRPCDISGVVEPIGAVLTLLAAQLVIPALPYLLSFAAGAMLYVVVEELIPEMSQGKHSNIGTIFFAVGFSVMMTLDVALG